MEKPRVAIHTFTICEGCQSAFLNLDLDLFEMSSAVELVHFAQVGLINPTAKVDIAFVSGGISWPHEISTLQRIRMNSRFFITIGACATVKGIQILKNITLQDDASKKIYATPDYVRSLKKSWVVSDLVEVDYELWGCPVTSKQCLEVVKSLSQKMPME